MAQTVRQVTVSRDTIWAIALVCVSVIALAGFLNPRVITQQQFITQTQQQFFTQTQSQIGYVTQVAYTTVTQVSYATATIGYGYGYNYPYYGYENQYPCYGSNCYNNNPYQSGNYISVNGYISPGQSSGCTYMMAYQAGGGVTTYALFRGSYTGSFTSGMHTVTGYLTGYGSGNPYVSCSGQALYVVSFT
jgi:hypothetical protein